MYFAKEMLGTRGESFEGKKVRIFDSGSGDLRAAVFSSQQGLLSPE